MTPPVRLATEHLFTVDVEDYFQVGAFEGVVAPEQWGNFPSRIERNVDALLDVLAAHDATGTFFTLGWVADRHPGVVRRIVEAGHEMASHGWWHRRVTTLTPDQFRSDVRASKAILEDVSGFPVRGYRAPNFSIVPGGEWAFDILLEEGYKYDSSLFPIRRPGYGYPDAPPIPHMIHREAGALCELPPATVSWRGVRIPAAGGAYLRHFPFSIIRRAFRDCEDGGIPGTFYIHPWELDPGQPRLPVPWHARMRHYSGLGRTLPLLRLLLTEFRFTSVARCLKLRPRPTAPLTVQVSAAAD
jgi:polysaccharide deacetylase family protein (PEP-CTERM system associated)